MTSRPAVVGGFILGAFALSVAGILFFGGMQLFATNLRVVVFFSESVADSTSAHRSRSTVCASARSRASPSTFPPTR